MEVCSLKFVKFVGCVVCSVCVCVCAEIEILDHSHKH